MTLTKDDLQSIRGVVREEVDSAVSGVESRLRGEIQGAEQRFVSEMDRRFIAQSKSMAQHFADLKAVMEHTYVNREEFEERYSELQNEVDDLRKEVHELKKQIAAP
jgi:hypothetical protein